MSSALPAEAGLRDFELHPPKQAKVQNLDTMSEAELLQLHTDVESRLKGLRLIEINLTKETLLQLKAAKLLQSDVNKEKSGVPANQKAQVQNSIGNIITTLAKIQMQLYDSEALKRLKAATVRVVRRLPKPQQDEFFELMDIEAHRIEEDLQG